MKACPRCAARGEAWVYGGSKPRCAFESGVFSGDNWNCATVNELRELVHPSFEVRSGVSAAYSGDVTAILAPVEIEGAPAHFLMMSWYKRRGRTEIVALLGCTDEPPPVLTPALAEAVIAHLEQTLLGVVPTPPELRS